MERAHQAVRDAATKVWRGFSMIQEKLADLMGGVLGRLDWAPPKWLLGLLDKAAPLGLWCNRHAAWVALALFVGLGGSWAAHFFAPLGGYKNWFAWQTLSGAHPSQDELRAAGISVLGPELTPYDGDAKPRPVVLRFTVSAAPLALVGKEAMDVEMSPALAGKWTWSSATTLEFLPDQDWPVGEKFAVTLGPRALAPHVEVDRKLSFSTPRFEVSVNGRNFYQDPVQVSLRRAVFEIGFSHPVNPESFEKNLRLEVGAGGLASLFEKPGEAQKLTVTFDKNRLAATVASEPLSIPKDTTSLSLVIKSGVAAQRGGNALGKDIVADMAIPGLFSLDVSELKQLIVTGDSGEPENLLQITTGMGVHEKEMARMISVWQLPDKHPTQQDGNDSYPWSDSAEVTEAILKSAKRLNLSALPAEREISELHAYKFSAEPGKYLFIRIPKGLKSAGGYQLGATRNEILKVKRSAPELAIMSSGSLLALSGEKKLPIIVRDLPGVHVEIGRLLPQQLQHLVTQSQGDMSKPEFYSGINPDNLGERFERKIPLNLRPGKTHYETINFADYLHSNAADRRGIFVVSVRGYDPKSSAVPGTEYDQGRRPYQYDDGEEGYSEGEGETDPSEAVDPASMKDRRLVIVTDLGIVSKLATDGTRDVFVQSIVNGLPVAGASVEVWARNGMVLASQATDTGGRAHLPSLTGMLREKLPVVLVVRKAGDMSYLPLNRAERSLDTSRFDVGGLRAASLPNQIQAYLFSDRGIYRPGDTMNIGIMAKSTNWAQRLADLPVEVEVVDARGLVVRREKLKLGNGGLAEFSHATGDTAPTGNYTINLNLARDTGTAAPGTPEPTPLRLGSVTVKVQEFMPDRMKVSARLSAESLDGWISPADLKGRVAVQNLFGTPAQNRRVEGVLTLSPAYPAFRAYPDYSFYDPARAKESIKETLNQTSTDDKGNAEFALGLQRYTQATYRLHLLVQAFEPEGGRAVAAEAGALVSDRSFLVGHKADGDLGYIAKNGVRNVNFIAIDAKTRKTAIGDLRLVRLERRVVSVLVKQANGLYKYESKARETVLKEDNFTIPQAGANVALATQTPGNFAYAVRDARGLELARVDYSVAGTGNVSRSLDRNAELQMTLNRKDYEPGDEIEVSIRAPYAGAGLITIERDKVYAYKWFRASDTASVQKIALPKDFEGNGYVSVQFTRDIGSKEIYMSPVSYGVVPFATSLSKRTNQVTLQTPDLIKPGQTAKFRLESKSPSRAIVFAVDEGILQVARYQTPDPLKYFFQKRALEVGTQQTLDLILPEFKKLMQAAAPGGDAEGMAGKHLNPFKRKTDKPVVFWSGVVEINGSKEFSYAVPESFNGALRVMAITVNDETVASATGKTTVRGDIVLLPNAPVAITPGDEVEIGVGVANNTPGSGKDAAVQVSLGVANGLEVLGAPRQTLKISENSEGSTTFRIRALPGAQAQLGSASLAFYAQVKDAKARLVTELSVRPASGFVTLAQTGLFQGEAKLDSKSDMYPNFKRSELAISSSPWAFTSGLIQYLDVYPHGCTEQITSQTFPVVIIAGQTGVAEQLLKSSRQGQSGGQIPDPRKSLERYLTQVRARQAADGGIAMWPGNGSDLFASTYVLSLLVEARDRKFAVPNDLMQRLNGYLQTKISSSSYYGYTWRIQAQAAYLLARQGLISAALLQDLRESLQTQVDRASEMSRSSVRRDLGVMYLASAFKLVKQEKLAQELMEPVVKQLLADSDPWKNWQWEYYYDPLVHQATVVQLMALHFPQLIKALPVDYWTRIADAIGRNYYQSLSAARILMAIDAYGLAAGQSAAGKVAVAALDRGGVAKALEVPEQLALAKLLVPPESAKLKLNNGGSLPLFYSWAESGYERNVPKEAVNSGLEIVREFLDGKGNTVSEARVGDELTVRVRVRTTNGRTVPQVALVDVLPGGMEPVLTAPSDSDAPDMPIWRRRLGGNGSWNIEYADIREDRVVFYGNVSDTMSEITYRVRVTNIGNFVVPAAYAEAMYERRVFGRSAGAGFKVIPAN